MPPQFRAASALLGHVANCYSLVPLTFTDVASLLASDVAESIATVAADVALCGAHLICVYSTSRGFFSALETSNEKMSNINLYRLDPMNALVLPEFLSEVVSELVHLGPTLPRFACP